MDPGLEALALLLRFHGVAVDNGQIAHQFAGARIGIPEMLRCAKSLKLKARMVTTDWTRLQKLQLPAIVECQGDTFIIVGKVNGEGALVHSPEVGRPQAVTRAQFEETWTGRVVLMARRASLGELARRFDLTWFVQAMQKYRRLLGEVLLASFFLQLFALATPLFFQVVTDKVLVHRGFTTLDVLVTGLIVVSVFETILGTLRTYVFAHTTNRIDVELGARLFRHLAALPIGYFEARRTGNTVARVRELENIRNFLTSSALTLLIDLLFTLVFLAVMLYYSPILTWIVIGSFPFYIAISAGATPAFHRLLAEKFERGAENQAFLVESVGGRQTLKAMAVEPQNAAALGGAACRVRPGEFSGALAGQLGEPAGAADQQGRDRADALFRCPSRDRRRSHHRRADRLQHAVGTGGPAGAATGPALAGFSPDADFDRAAGRYPELRAGAGLQSGARGAAADPRRHRPRERLVPLPDRRVEVLHEVSLKVPAGQVVGIVGPSGSGKSTLTKLVQRLYVPERGRVLIDGVDLAVVDVAWLRRQVGSVLQENVLFNRSIRDNIALADPGMPMDRVIAAAELAGAHEFILELPQGYDTMVGERGASLSGGQRQRIAIARALVTDPRILIFDEATSALDYESERIIQMNMRRIAKGRTLLVIAHRLSAVRHSDRIITIEKGRIVEDGSHDELIRKSGRYADLHRLQAGLSLPRLLPRLWKAWRSREPGESLGIAGRRGGKPASVKLADRASGDSRTLSPVPLVCRICCRIHP
jgi:subfamily B ATP-binding cassette protein HlyB/CyaB